MRSLRFLSLFLLPAALVVVGCGEQNSPTDPGAASILADGGSTGGELTANEGNGVVFSARGSMHKEGQFVGGEPLEGWVTFTFTAEQRQDLTTTGHMLFDRKGGTQQHGRVFCMKRIANSDIVLVAAESTKRTSDNDPANNLGLPQPDLSTGNHGIFFAVRDNGEGANASPDQFTGMVHTLEQVAAAVCADPEILSPPNSGIPAWAIAESFFNDADAGNIQVTFP